jgi:hypothetical protein
LRVICKAINLFTIVDTILLNTTRSLGEISLSTLLANYGFSQGDEFKVSCLEEGKIVLEKKRSNWIVWE